METEENKHTTKKRHDFVAAFHGHFLYKTGDFFLKILATFWAHAMRLQPNFPDGALDFLEVALM